MSQGRGWAPACVLLWLSGCAARDVAFRCTDNQHCTRSNGDGVCEPNGFCSFGDSGCKSGRRYGDLAEDGVKGRCVSCGDGVVDPGEACDDGNTNPNDGCLPGCIRATCGDGIVRTSVEDCDPGSKVDATCTKLCKRCTPGPNSFSWTSTGHCYFRTEATATFADARAECVRTGAHLATFTSSYEVTEVTNRLGTNRTDAWIGLTVVAATFGWITDEALVVTAWDMGEPRAETDPLLPPRTCAVHTAMGKWRAQACTTPREALCEDDGWSIAPSNNHAYRAISEPLTWDKAVTACADLNAHLVTITDDAEQAFIAGQFPGDRWLGAGDQTVEGTFVWLTGEPFVYKRFAPEDPDDTPPGQDCLMLGGERLWHDRDCADLYGVICEID